MSFNLCLVKNDLIFLIVYCEYLFYMSGKKECVNLEKIKIFVTISDPDMVQKFIKYRNKVKNKTMLNLSDSQIIQSMILNFNIE